MPIPAMNWRILWRMIPMALIVDAGQKLSLYTNKLIDDAIAGRELVMDSH